MCAYFPQVDRFMKRELAIEFSRVTEAAALAGYKWLGRGDKNLADGAAVEAMRFVLNQIEISGEIVIGEGEIDEAPMLYIGEKVGAGGEEVEIAVDPIDGTRMTAMGQANAVAVLAAGVSSCSTSQCSTNLPPRTRKMSTPTIGRSAQPV